MSAQPCAQCTGPSRAECDREGMRLTMDAIFDRSAADEWEAAHERWWVLEETARNWGSVERPQPAAARKPDPCPTCSGQKRESDGTFTLRTPLWEYVTGILHDLANGQSHNPAVLRMLAHEIDRETKR